MRDLIRSALAYISGKSALDDLQRQLLAISWDREVPVEPGARELANELELAIAEYTGGEGTEDDLRQLVAQAVRGQIVHVNAAPVVNRWASQNVTLQHTVACA